MVCVYVSMVGGMCVCYCGEWYVCMLLWWMVCVYVNPVKDARPDEKSTGARQNSTVKSDSGYAGCIKKKTGPTFLRKLVINSNFSKPKGKNLHRERAPCLHI